MVPSPRISVVVPVYNAESYLPTCLSSVAEAVSCLPAERRDQVEVITCDNWSSDGSPGIMRSAVFACEHRHVRPPQHEPNRTRNWRVGIAAARGVWIMMLHADDVMAKGALNGLLDALDSGISETASLIVGRHRTFKTADSPSRLFPRWAIPTLIDGTAFASEILPYHCPFVPFILFRSADYAEAGGLDERWELVQDWELWMRLAQRGDIFVIGVEVGHWRLHGTSPAYRRLNAREHVELAASQGASAPHPGARAMTVALARAALQLHGTGTRDGNTDDWLDGRVLPDVGVASRRLLATHRRVAANQAILKVLGVPRLLRRRLAP